MAYQRISFEIKDNVLWVGFGLSAQKSMTVFDEETFLELKEIVQEIENRAQELKGVIFFTHKENCFIAGADVNLIRSLSSESMASERSEMGQFLFNRIEDLKIPTLCLVNGVCLGGGLEFALSCKKILASNSSKTVFALPEVKLGILPGFGGTYRLPRKIGLPASLDMILSGSNVKAEKAKKLGLVEEVYPVEKLSEMALLHLFKNPRAKDMGISSGIKETVAEVIKENFITKKIIFQKARESVLKKTHGFYQAPLKILDLMDSGVLKGRTSYLASEAQAFGELAISEQAKNLMHIFFMSENVKKFPHHMAGEFLADDKTYTILRGATLGAGTMGGGIAWLMAERDMHPIMKDLNVDSLNLGLKQSAQNFKGALKRKKMTYDEFERKQRSITPTLEYHGFKKVDLAIEAVVENMDIKKKVFAEVENYVKDECLLTSNTSSLSIGEMSKALKRPERFLGLHFFNPVHLMPLVEIITHDKLSKKALEAAYQFVLDVKKIPIIVKDGPGFLVNRILMPYLNEAGYLLSEGVTIKDIDQAALNFGMPMGPLRLLDEVGLDVAEKVSKVMHQGLGDRAMPSEISGKLVQKGLLGKKNLKGFYLYSEDGKNSKNPEINLEVELILPDTKKKMSENEIQKRLFLPMINEASYILAEGIADSAQTVDVGLIYGIGFPPFRGGLLRYAESVGLKNILDALNTTHQSLNAPRYRPSEYFVNLVNEGKSFYTKT